MAISFCLIQISFPGIGSPSKRYKVLGCFPLSGLFSFLLNSRIDIWEIGNVWLPAKRVWTLIVWFSIPLIVQNHTSPFLNFTKSAFAESVIGLVVFKLKVFSRGVDWFFELIIFPSLKVNGPVIFFPESMSWAKPAFWLSMIGELEMSLALQVSLAVTLVDGSI